MSTPFVKYPTITVIVPVKNNGNTIRDLLDSLLNLDYDKNKLEIIIVDGGSQDNTRNTVLEYPVVLVDEEGQGLNSARNTGIKWSTGEILAYTEGDCIVPPGWAKEIAKNFSEPEVSFVGGMVKGYEEKNFISTYVDETFFQVKPGFTKSQMVNDLYLLNFPAGSNMAFRREALEKINFFDERIDYGFDDLLPIEELGNKGFSLVLDSELWVYHQSLTNMREILKQHYNLGRGGSLLLLHKPNSRLATWFSTYLVTTTFAISLFVMLIWASFFQPELLPFDFALGFFTFGFMILASLYLRTAIRSRSLKKLILYPIFDILRGLFFTWGGLSQLIVIVLVGRVDFRRSEK